MQTVADYEFIALSFFLAPCTNGRSIAMDRNRTQFAITIDLVQAGSVPLGRTLETNLDNLVRIGDVVPATVSLPAIGNNLNESAAEGRVRNVGGTFAVGFDVQFDFLILLDGVLLDIFYIDAGIFHGLGLVAGGHFDGEAGRLIGLCGGLRGRFRLSGRRILSSDAKRCGHHKGAEKNSPFGLRKFHVPVDPISHGKFDRLQVTPL